MLNYLLKTHFVVFADLARRDPGSGRWPMFAALAGNSCGSSHSEADSLSNLAPISAPTYRPEAVRYLLPKQMVGP